MKNIHVLPTDKPSRLYLNTGEWFFENDYSLSVDECINQNIYITSDEEIKEGDYCMDGDDIYGPFEEGDIATVKFIKIILTTDQDLIKYGVQAIDDDFLEWFVKNPSREEILVGTEIWNDGTWNYILPKQPDEQSTKQIISMPGGIKTFRESVFDLLDRLLVNNMCSHQADWEIREFINKYNLEPDGKV